MDTAVLVLGEQSLLIRSCLDNADLYSLLSTSRELTLYRYGLNNSRHVIAISGIRLADLIDRRTRLELRNTCRIVYRFVPTTPRRPRNAESSW